MNNLMALFSAFGAGMFLFIGYGIVSFIKNTDQFVEFSISMAFGVIVVLMGIEILPEGVSLAIEQFGTYGIFYFICTVFVGFFFLKGLDYFIPDHETGSKEETQKQQTFYHIGFVSSIALILHNLLEGMSIYTMALTKISMAISMMFGVGLHNIPLGIVIASTLRERKQGTFKTFFFLVFLSISTFLGGLLLFFNPTLMKDGVTAILLGITLGMLFYIAFFELLEEVLQSQKKQNVVVGISIGVVVFFVSLLFG